jgi:hypothetical protein
LHPSNQLHTTKVHAHGLHRHFIGLFASRPITTESIQCFSVTPNRILEAYHANNTLLWISGFPLVVMSNIAPPRYDSRRPPPQPQHGDFQPRNSPRPSVTSSDIRPGSDNKSALPDNWESQWLFTEEELLQTPSVLDGISPEVEREQRSKGCNFITQLGIQLKLPQLTLATASTYLHRFYMQNSLKRHHYYVRIHPLHHGSPDIDRR